ncbi:hypothetical protein PLICRDRAFT_700865 [Plicaturopsis crispa FD-325 SS-3]|nr:hypothetical protein PLICRDRAFT_700865 [Plicaturopsis crispa FD-325 SS-3]
MLAGVQAQAALPARLTSKAGLFVSSNPGPFLDGTRISARLPQHPRSLEVFGATARLQDSTTLRESAAWGGSCDASIQAPYTVSPTSSSNERTRRDTPTEVPDHEAPRTAGPSRPDTYSRSRHPCPFTNATRSRASFHRAVRVVISSCLSCTVPHPRASRAPCRIRNGFHAETPGSPRRSMSSLATAAPRESPRIARFFLSRGLARRPGHRCATSE